MDGLVYGHVGERERGGTERLLMVSHTSDILKFWNIVWNIHKGSLNIFLSCILHIVELFSLVALGAQGRQNVVVFFFFSLIPVSMCPL